MQWSLNLYFFLTKNWIVNRQVRSTSRELPWIGQLLVYRLGTSFQVFSRRLPFGSDLWLSVITHSHPELREEMRTCVWDWLTYLEGLQTNISFDFLPSVQRFCFSMQFCPSWSMVLRYPRSLLWAFASSCWLWSLISQNTVSAQLAFYRHGSSRIVSHFQNLNRAPTFVCLKILSISLKLRLHWQTTLRNHFPFTVHDVILWFLKFCLTWHM